MLAFKLNEQHVSCKLIVLSQACCNNFNSIWILTAISGLLTEGSTQCEWYFNFATSSHLSQAHKISLFVQNGNLGDKPFFMINLIFNLSILRCTLLLLLYYTLDRPSKYLKIIIVWPCSLQSSLFPKKSFLIHRNKTFRKTSFIVAVLVVKWSAESALNQEVMGSIPAPKKLFSIK